MVAIFATKHWTILVISVKSTSCDVQLEILRQSHERLCNGYVISLMDYSDRNENIGGHSLEPISEVSISEVSGIDLVCAK